MNCKRRHDFPTPFIKWQNTCITNDDEFKHIRKWHGLLTIKQGIDKILCKILIILNSLIYNNEHILYNKYAIILLN